MDHPSYRIVTVTWVGTTLSRLIGQHVHHDPLPLGRAVAEAVQRHAPGFDTGRFLADIQTSHDRHHPPTETTPAVPAAPDPPIADN